MSTLRDTNVSTADEAAQADALREAMIAELRELKAIRSDRVADAFRTVPRHLFAPGEPLERAYAADSAVVTKRGEHGAAVSAVSSAHMQATMLEQAQLGSGMRVLEIGSGGYNAALIAELVGESGQVTTVDIDPDIVDGQTVARYRGRPARPVPSQTSLRENSRPYRRPRSAHYARSYRHPDGSDAE